MRNSVFWWVIVAVMVLLDLYVFQAIKVVTQGASHKLRVVIYTGYWGISAAALILLIIIPFINYDSWPRSVRTYLFATVVGLFFAKVVAVLFFLLDDIRRVIQWASSKLFFPQYGRRGDHGPKDLKISFFELGRINSRRRPVLHAGVRLQQ